MANRGWSGLQAAKPESAQALLAVERVAREHILGRIEESTLAALRKHVVPAVSCATRMQGPL